MNNKDTVAKLLFKDLEEGVISIANALWGTYIDEESRAEPKSERIKKKRQTASTLCPRGQPTTTIDQCADGA